MYLRAIIRGVTRLSNSLYSLNRNELKEIKRITVFLHLRTIRLLGHAGSDIESHYWTKEQITANESFDPLLHSARIVLENNCLSAIEILDHYQRVRDEVQKQAKQVIKEPKLSSAREVMEAIVPKKVIIKNQLSNDPKNLKCFFI